MNRFGYHETVVSHDAENGQFEKHIDLGGDNNKMYFNYKTQEAHLKEMTSVLKGEKIYNKRKDLMADPNTNNCHTLRQNQTNPDEQFMFLPSYTGQIKPANPKVSFEGNCFEEITFEMVYDESNPAEFQVLATTSKKRTATCSDWFLFGNTEITHAEEFVLPGQHKLKFKAPGPHVQEDVKVNGLETYLFCESMRDELISVFNTVKMYVGGLGMHGKIPLFEPAVPEYMIEANRDFLKWSLDWDLEERTNGTNVEIDESEIASGDYFAVTRLDGLDPMIMWGTGSHSGHSVIALRMDGELYITES